MPAPNRAMAKPVTFAPTPQPGVQGLERVRIGEYVQEEPYLLAKVERIPEPVVTNLELQAFMRNTIKLFGQLVVVCKEWRHVRAERNASGAGERGEIEDEFRIILVGEREGVGQDQAALGVGIADFDGDAFARDVDVARPEGGAGNRVLHCRDQDAQTKRELA